MCSGAKYFFMQINCRVLVTKSTTRKQKPIYTILYPYYDGDGIATATATVSFG